MVSATKDPLTFNDLMATPIDFSKYVLNQLKIDNFTLLGPAYNLLKGHPDHLIVVVDYFFNNDLEVLKMSDPEKTYTISITKTKAIRYEIVGIKDMKILGVKSVSVKKLHGYGHLEDIMVKRADRQIYKFKEGDFVDLHFNYIEDMLLLVVQHKGYVEMGLCGFGLRLQAKELLDDILARRILLDFDTFNVVMNFLRYSRNGELNEANELFNEMQESCCLPDGCTYKTIIKGFLLHNEMSKAFHFIDKTRSNRFKIDAYTEALLLRFQSRRQLGHSSEKCYQFGHFTPSVARPNHVWNETWKFMKDDIEHCQCQQFNNPEYFELEYDFEECYKALSEKLDLENPEGGRLYGTDLRLLQRII
ncbi:retrovirus-related pol polyprotein from transposon TNT 1-94 [Tanacetum coccineum]|uniref:Retrovirus-related pol polyprotein from transposon TNT 1-94 n=1 Tax=Tanacetum coccineum TaxID=301880 RepID=A0ABQ5DNB0_9ASTR